MLEFNDTPALVGRFVSFPREREKRDRRDSRGDERVGQERKENEWQWRNKNIPLYSYLTLPNCKSVSAGRPGDVRYTGDTFVFTSPTTPICNYYYAVLYDDQGWRDPPRGLGNMGIMSFISGEQGNTSLKRREQWNTCSFGEQGTEILILGNKGKLRNISGEQGNRYPPWEGLK